MRLVIRNEILDGIGDAIYGVAADWTVLFFNRRAEEFFGRPREDVVGRNLWDIFPAARETELADALHQAMRTREETNVELLSPTTGKYAALRLFPLNGGGLGVSWHDITEKKKMDIALREAVENQDMLFRELAHRVTNNFQEVAARVDLQGRDLRDPAAREMCEKMATSIRCMAVVHRRLYSSRAHIDEQDLGEYVRALCEDLASSLPKNIALSSVVEAGAAVSVDVATTVGMIIAELVTNARKYAWPAGEAGRMVVTMRREADAVEIELRDDGKGLPEGMDLRRSAGLGLKLLNLQVKRLRGSFSHHNRKRGAVFLLRFPLPKRQRSADSRPIDRARPLERPERVRASEAPAAVPGAQDWLDAMDGVAYLVDAEGTVIGVGTTGWSDFADANGSDSPKPAEVIGRRLFDMIEASEVRLAFEAVHRRVATLAKRALTYEYRCDAPDLERLMKMSVSALTARGGLTGVLYQSTILSSKERVPLAFLSSQEAGLAERCRSSLPIVIICAFCANVTTSAWGSEWVRPADYYRRGGGDAVRISHGICPECEQTRLQPLLKA